MLELGVDVGATGLDKYGTLGPRFGLLGGTADLVARIRAKGFECGLEVRPMLYQSIVRTLEKYSPKRVQELIDTTKGVASALRPIFGKRLHETPTTAQLLADDLLEIAMERVPCALGADALGAVASGEEYELLVTLPRAFGVADAQAFQEFHDLPLTRVGDVVAGAGVRFTDRGAVVTPAGGWDHFA